MFASQLFSKFEGKKERVREAGKVLLVTHNDMDASGAVICLKEAFGRENVDVIRCSNAKMSMELRNAVTNPEVADHYDFIFGCDISCNAEDAKEINRNPNKRKFILLDHHMTVDFLNQYPWAVVNDRILQDTDRYRNYYVYNDVSLSDASSSGTSLMHDFLCQAMPEYAKKAKTNPVLNRIVEDVAAYDTWDWVNVFQKKYVEPDELDTLFKIYDADAFEEKMLDRIDSYDPKTYDYELFDDMDRFLLELEKKKVENFLQRAKGAIKVGTLKLKDQYLKVAFTTETSYVQELFNYMRETIPDVDYYMINCGGVLSIRSTKPEMHAGKFAALYGGGGHQGAAGINVSWEDQTNYVAGLLHGEIFLESKEERRERLDAMKKLEEKLEETSKEETDLEK